MRLLLDANILWKLIHKLKKHFDDCRHVDHIELSIPASDITIWEYALINNMTIVTNDQDFLNLINLRGFPPKVILLKTGNQSNHYIESLLIKHIPDIQLLGSNPEVGLLQIV
jgi:predicted nuclease of predicted toxin-antitoxin system